MQNKSSALKTLNRAITTFTGKSHLKQPQSVKQRSVMDRSHPCLSPINTRRTAEERQEAKKRTQDKKRLMRIKRDTMAISQALLNEMVDELSIVTVYQTYF